MAYLASYLFLFPGLWFLFYLTGYAVEGWIAAPTPPRAEDPAPPAWLVRLALGTSLWIYLLFTLAAARFLTPLAVYLATVLLVAWAAVRRVRLGAPTLESVKAWLPSRTRLSPGQTALLVALCAVVAVLFVQALRPDVSWDAAVYHLTVPRLYLEAQGFLPIPFNVYSNWPLNVELLFALGMIFKDYVLAKLVHFGFGILTTAAVFHLARGCGGTWAGLLAAALFLGNGVVLFEIRIAYIDLAYAFFFLLAFWFVSQALDRTAHRGRALLLAGLCCGTLAGVKLTGVFGLVCLVVLYLVERRRSPGNGDPVWRSLALLTLPAVLLVSPWVAKTWILTGNPVYPFFHSWFGGPEWSQELSRLNAEWQQSMGMGRSPLDYLLLPVRVILQGDHGYAHFDGKIHPAWIVLLPLAAVMARHHRLLARGLWVSLLYFVLWSLSSQQMRFLIPILPLLSIAAGCGVAGCVAKVSRQGRTWVHGALVVLFIGGLVHSNNLYFRQCVPLLRSFLRHGEGVQDLLLQRVYPVFAFINRELPKNARILFVNTNQGFFCHRDYIADSFFEASQIRDLMRDVETEDEVVERLKELGLTHILVDHRDLGIPYPAAFVELVRNRRQLDLLYRSPDQRFSLFRLRLADAGNQVR